MMAKKEVAILALAVLAISCTISLALAQPSLTIEPSDITPGVPINITGTGFRDGENITLITEITCWKPIVGGKCECTMGNFELLKGMWLKLSVFEVDNNVSLYITKWPLPTWEVTPGFPGFFFSYNTATHTSKVATTAAVPVGGRFTIDVIGDAYNTSAPNCTMITNATMNFNGNFSLLNIDTTGIPICNFTVTATGDASGTAQAYLNLFLKGDASKDGRVNSYDCSCIARCIAQFPGYCTCCPYTSDTISVSAGDVDGTPGLTIDDAKYLAEYLIGMHGL
jgi:hypothetical protein